MRTINQISLHSIRFNDQSFSAGFRTIAVKILAVFRTRRNRVQLGDLYEFTDEQLRDIGLERGDVKSAFQASHFFDDPSHHLTHTARHRAWRSLH